MATRITLNELKKIVKQVVKENRMLKEYSKSGAESVMLKAAQQFKNALDKFESTRPYEDNPVYSKFGETSKFKESLIDFIEYLQEED